MGSDLAFYGGEPIRCTAFPEWPVFSDTERSLLIETLESRRWWATQGTKVKEFERKWGTYNHGTTSVAVTNGSHTLEIALLALGVGEGDEVIVPNWTFFATVAAVLMINAVPVLVDVKLDTGCIDASLVRKAITKRTKAVIPVHIAGSCADMDALLQIAKEFDLAIVEDCAHAHGSSWDDIPAGMIGDAGSYSFQSSKLMTAGEGGAIISKHADVLSRARSLADCGRLPGEWFYSHYSLGGNYRMTEWQGAVLLAQLERFPEQRAIRSENAKLLNSEFAKIPGIYPQKREVRCTSQGNYCYVLRVDKNTFGLERDRIRELLISEGIPLTMAYPALSKLELFTNPRGLEPRIRKQINSKSISEVFAPISEMLAESTLWFNTSILMGENNDALDAVRALHKIFENRHLIKRSEKGANK